MDEIRRLESYCRYVLLLPARVAVEPNGALFGVSGYPRRLPK